METIKRLLKKSPLVYYLVRQFKLSRYQPDLKRLVVSAPHLWEISQKLANKSDRRILLASSIGSNFASTVFEGVLAVALTLRGAKPEVLLCDGVLSACMECWIGYYWNASEFISFGPGRMCHNCFTSALKAFRKAGVSVLQYSDFLSEEDWKKIEAVSSTTPVEEIFHFTMDGCAIGEHVVAGALRFLARGSFEGKDWEELLLRRYFKAGLITYYVMKNLLAQRRYNAVVAQHGIYIPQGVIGEVCRRQEVRVVNWNPGYRKGTFIFSHHDTYHKTILTEPPGNWQDISWNEEREKRLISYLRSRWTGANDWIWFHERPVFDWEKIKDELGIDSSRPIIGLLTSVIWDARLHYESNVFSDMVEWVVETIRYFEKRADLQLLIRIHPAEIRGTLPSRQPMLDEIKTHFPHLPRNVFVIPPESRVSSYVAMLRCNAVIIYNTKMGIEIAAMGLPVIVAGEAWIRGKGFAIDVLNKKHYRKLLDSLPFDSPLEGEKLLLAKKYAYHYFFRRLIPIFALKKACGNPPYRIRESSLEALKEGRDPGLDVVCEGILEGTPFIYDN